MPKTTESKLRYCNSDRGRDKYYQRKFGISLDDYNALLLRQKECCLICGIHQDNHRTKLSVDHCHTNGHIRGLLCHQCNKVLGQFKDDVERFKKAIRYLQGDL